MPPDGSANRDAESLETISFVVASADGKVIAPSDLVDVDSVASAIVAGVLLYNRYRIEREIGRGSFGIVYLSTDERLSRRVAIKVIAPMRLDTDEQKAEWQARKRLFEQEAKIGAELQDPAIATVFDYGFHEGRPFIVFEYVAGETLRAVMRRRRRIPVEDVRLFVAEVSSALDQAHRQQVVHRDLKPDNIRVGLDGRYKILDFGLARRFKGRTKWVFAGTPAYAAPEQVLGSPGDGRLDQYALACIAFEMLTGRFVFDSREVKQLLRMHVTAPAPSPRAYAPELPQSVADAIERALSKDPASRFRSCKDFAAAVGCAFQATPAPALEILKEANAYTPRGFVEAGLPWATGGKVRIALDYRAFWIYRSGSVESWPLRELRVLREDGDLEFVINEPKRRRLCIVLSPDVSREWEEAINGIQENLHRSSHVAFDTLPASQVVALVRHAPNVPLQIIGPVEAMGANGASSRAALSLRAAMIGADAVVDIVDERITDFDGSLRRVSGIAVKSIDRLGMVELRLRGLTDAISRTSKYFAALIAGYGTYLLLRAATSSMEAPWFTVFVSIGFMFWWPLATTVALRILAWPQLILVCIASVAATAPLDPCFAIFGIAPAFAAWRVFSQYRSLRRIEGGAVKVDRRRQPIYAGMLGFTAILALLHVALRIAQFALR